MLVSTAQKPRGDARAVFMNRNHLTEWRGKQIAAFDMRGAPALIGAHNHQNACAAWAACRAVGLAPRQIEAGFASFPGLAHRLERIGSVRGVAFVNDSKATNADAAAKALASFERIRWIAGGRPKEGGIVPLRPLFGRIAKAYLIGEAAAGVRRDAGRHAARDLRHAGAPPSPPPPPTPSRATPSCSPRPAPASTSSPISRRAARRSASSSARCSPRPP